MLSNSIMRVSLGIQSPCQMIGVYNHLQKARYLGSTTILSRWLDPWGIIGSYCWWFRNPAFTSWYGSLSHYLQGFYTSQVVVWDSYFSSTTFPLLFHDSPTWFISGRCAAWDVALCGAIDGGQCALPSFFVSCLKKINNRKNGWLMNVSGQIIATSPQTVAKEGKSPYFREI